MAPRGIALLLMLALANSHNLRADADPLQAYTWENRLLLIFSPDDNHAQYLRQQRDLAKVEAGLAERHLLVFHLRPGAEAMLGAQLAGFPSAQLYRDYAVDPSTYAVILVGKDGSPKLIRRHAVEIQTLFDLIDSMPMRQWEMQNPDA